MEEKRRETLVEEREVLVACSDQSMKIGVTMWELDTGEKMFHIPSCASPPFGLLCLRNRFLVASQVNKNGSVGSGSIVVWPLNKPQQSLLNYTAEGMGPLSCTKDGIYLVGGGLSGKAYIWDVTSGKLLKTWSAHYQSIKHMLFSDDDCLLISGSYEGVICVWSMISLLDVEEMGSSPPLLHCFSGHASTITGLLTALCCYLPVLISSSLDGTCKVWDVVTGRLMQTQIYPLAITCIALHQGQRLLFCGTENGTIIVNKLDIGLQEDPPIILKDLPLELKGHSGAITVMTSSREGLISASEDYTICIWDVVKRVAIRHFDFHGKVSNLLVVPRSSMLSTSNHKRAFDQYVVSPLDKYPRSIYQNGGATTLLSLCHLHKEKQTDIDLLSSSLLRQNMSGSQKAHKPTAMAIQMKAETNTENRIWAINMAKHVMVINKQLQSHLLELISDRLSSPNGTNFQKMGRKKPKIKSTLHEEENQEL